MLIAYYFDCIVDQIHLQQVVAPKYNRHSRYMHCYISANQNIEAEQVVNSAHNRNLDFGAVGYSFAVHIAVVGFVDKPIGKQFAVQVDMQFAVLGYDVQDEDFDKSVLAEQFDNKTVSL